MVNSSFSRSSEHYRERRIDRFYFRAMSSGDRVCLLLMEEIGKIPVVENIVQISLNSERFVCSSGLLAVNS